MDQGLIPNRYAKALYGFALERGQADRIYGLMKAIVASFAAEPRLQDIMANPFIAIGDKKKLLMTAAGATNDDACYIDFLRLLDVNKRLPFVRGIALSYLAIYRKERRIYLVDVVTAAKLPQQQLDKLRQIVERHLDGATIEWSTSINPELIGGFVININSERLDASISNELKQLRLKLLSN